MTMLPARCSALACRLTRSRTTIRLATTVANTSSPSSSTPMPSSSSGKTYSPYVRIDGQFKTYKPRTPGLRWVRRPVNAHLHKGGPLRALTVAKRKTGGRNNQGRITTRHVGGGHRRRIRLIDYYRKQGGICDVVRIEYDPNRTAHLALLRHRETAQFSYIIAPKEIRAGDTVQSFRNGLPSSLSGLDEGMLRAHTIGPGNCLPIKMIPVGTLVHNIGSAKNGPAKFVRSAGTFAQILQTGNSGYAQIRLSSGEVRRIPVEASATIGTVSNPDHQHRMLGKAGRSRWLGIRPTVRGVAMNAVDHPHGGGRGKSKGNKHPRSIWGWKTKGMKTRHSVNNMLVKPRPRGKEQK